MLPVDEQEKACVDLVQGFKHNFKKWNADDSDYKSLISVRYSFIILLEEEIILMLADASIANPSTP